MNSWQFHTHMRYGSASFFRGGMQRQLRLGMNQPLLLIPEPNNPVQPTAVRVADLMGQPVGYLAAEDAPVVFERLAARHQLLARTDGEPSRRDGCPVLVWEEGQPEEATEEELVLDPTEDLEFNAF